MEKLFIEDLPIEGKKVLLRADFNVPLDGDLNVIDATKIEATLPSIRYVLARKGALILMSHLGRPKQMPDAQLSLGPIARVLSLLLDQEVDLAPNCIGAEVEKKVRELRPGGVLLLENLRFHRAEEFPQEDPSFAKEIASFGALYVNDAFGASHRKHSSITEVPRYFVGRAAGGYLLFKEMTYLGETLIKPKRPFYAILGGAKVSTKLGVIKSLLEKVDKLLIGGAMAYTFLASLGMKVGKSLVEEAFLDRAKTLYSPKIVLPVDCVGSDKISEDEKVATFNLQTGVPQTCQCLDIGPKTVELFCKTIQDGKTIFWNGPLGVYELDPFAKGTEAVGNCVANLQTIKVVGGGDLIAALNPYGLLEKMSHVSTGGGASLEYIEYGTLPGIEALSNSLKTEVR